MAAALALAQAHAPPTGIRIIGVGNDSCATAFRRENLIQSQAWIYGFWSGRNSERRASVGFSTDANGIVGEVERLCRLSPSTALVIAATVAYDAMETDGR
jgi:hypothetical protein